MDKQQLEQKGIAYQALENGILSCDDPQALQGMCDRLSEGKIDALLRKWLRRLPHPFAPQDRQAGYRYQLSILQLELSLTQVLDQPVSGRIFFQANRRLLQVQRISHDCILAEEAFQQINRPVQVTSQRASALRFAAPNVQALWRALFLFQVLPTGFPSRHLHQHFASLLGQPPDSLTRGQMTYHLHRLRLTGSSNAFLRLTATALPTSACERRGSAPESTAASSVPDSQPYYPSSPHPSPRSGAASTNLIRRSHPGSNTQN